MSDHHLDIHLIQCSPERGDKVVTLNRLDTLIHSTIEENPNYPQLIVLPEMFATGFTFEEDLAESMDGDVVCWMLRIAQSLGVGIYGSVLISENGNLYNRGIFVHPNGQMHYYDKRHLFCGSDEPKYVTAGNKIVTVPYFGWHIRLNICYDLRFPVWSRNIHDGKKYDYDILLNCACWPSERAHAWTTLLTARAIENQAYVVGINRVGSAGKTEYCGDSMAIDANGNLLKMAQPNTEEIVTVRLDKSLLKEFREEFRVSKDWDTYEVQI